MARNAIPLNATLFTPEDVAAFYRVAAGWLRRDLCSAVRWVRTADADSLLVMGGNRSSGSPGPLWGVEKHPDQTYWLVDRSRRALAFGATMDEVLEALDPLAGAVGAAVH